MDIPACYAPFSDVFCPKRASKLPPHRPWDCAIDLLLGEPVPRGKIYPLSSPEEKAMEEYIEEALAQGYIRSSTSPAASSFFFVAKKDGGLRPCIDYRALNQITVKFRYPLPLIPAALEHLRGATVFTKLDLRSAYNLIRIREGDEWKTAFVTPTGHYDYLVMPYGLANAPSVFQDFIHEVLREFLHRFVLVYIDDILIYSRNLAEHRHHVAEVLKHLGEFQLFLKAEKCSFHQPSVQFLGYNIDSSGIRMDEGKVAAIRDWPMPTTVKELQRFLGFANFYTRFIWNYSSIDNPLTSLLRNKPKSLSWTSSAEEAFNTLKEAFTTAPLLVHPDPDRPFIVEVDASTTGVGAVLSQQQENPASSIRRRPGSKNTKADALSRLFTPEENTEVPETILLEKGLPTAMETAELMFNHIFRYFGIPEDIVSNRGPQFISRVWKAFFSHLGVAVSLSSGYHPQTNGQMERKIQEIDVLLDIVVGGAVVLFKRFTKCKREKRAGTLVKLRQRGFRTVLPSIHLANLRSLPNKMDELLLLSQTNKDFSNSAALCFTESWLNDVIPDSVLNLPGFQLFRADRVAESAGKSRGGGTCFYINERWCTDVTVLKKMCCPDLEAFFINCKPFYSPRQFSSFILVSVYIPPQAHVSSALQYLADQITHTEQQHPDSVIIILWDFNKANLSHELPKFKQHISCPTRDKNILDHCYTTIKDAYRSVPRAALGLSDHCLVHFSQHTGQNLNLLNL
ncbi:hypothetical protein QTP70_021111 [Hemibagrus guttatus]|uniref:ribonuclease H n=1 Tax=Hemibagrus guttatus TaxID=175788 RepID=A0AAE0QXS5_9TELE|nr:hypothetical protein QTP70_021111 [Hemibagrus guttatus]